MSGTCEMNHVWCMRAHHQPFIHLHRLMRGSGDWILVYILKVSYRQVLLKCRWNNIGCYSLKIAILCKNKSEVISPKRTYVRSISCLLGLLDARTMRFPASFLITGTWRACGRICCLEVIVVANVEPGGRVTVSRGNKRDSNSSQRTPDTILNVPASGSGTGLKILAYLKHRKISTRTASRILRQPNEVSRVDRERTYVF